MLRAAIKCPGTGECLRRDGRSGKSPCGIHCTCAIKRAACRLCRSILAYSALVIVAIMTIVALIAMQLRQSALDAGRASAANYSAAFGEQAQRALDSVAGAMERVKQRIEAEGDRIRSLPVDQACAGACRPAHLGRGDRAGREGPCRGSREKPRAHRSFRPGLFPGPPRQPQCRALHRQTAHRAKSNQVTIQLARRLEKPGGGFAGRARILARSRFSHFASQIGRS